MLFKTSDGDLTVERVVNADSAATMRFTFYCVASGELYGRDVPLAELPTLCDGESPFTLDMLARLIGDIAPERVEATYSEVRARWEIRVGPRLTTALSVAIPRRAASGDVLEDRVRRQDARITQLVAVNTELKSEIAGMRADLAALASIALGTHIAGLSTTHASQLRQKLLDMGGRFDPVYHYVAMPYTTMMWQRAASCDCAETKECVKLRTMLEAGLDPNCRNPDDTNTDKRNCDNHGETLLHHYVGRFRCDGVHVWAARVASRTAHLRTLLQYGANKLAEDATGATPREWIPRVLVTVSAEITRAPFSYGGNADALAKIPSIGVVEAELARVRDLLS